ncbi:hypothetical protein [Mesorhizobium australicum]|uniref:hypothetical protein n=1 Tax=Mesorhizobium australicum TaxID=536018 RepID=UPI00333B9AFF
MTIADGTVDGGRTRYNLNLKTNDAPVSEGGTPFCLDFLLSAFSDDHVGIQREPNGLLDRIYTRAQDQSKPIADALIRAAGDMVAASKAGGLDRLARQQVLDAGGSAVFASLDYDPFEEGAATEINRGLRSFGYCIYLDPRDDPYVPAWSSPEICNRRRVGRDPGPDNYGFEKMAARKLMQRGVLYRPELSHRLMILRKDDPDNPREAWHLAATEYVQMPNKAPIFALGVNRAIFVTAETDVKFDKGNLQNVTVVKPSELNAAVDIPLYAAQVALSIPAATLSIFQNEAANRKQLWQTNAQLIDTLRQMKQDTTADQAVAQGQMTAAERVAVGDPGGNSQPLIATRSAGPADASPSLQRLGNCLDDETIAPTAEERAAKCMEIMKAGQ